MNYSLRTVGKDGLPENVLIGHNVKYMGRKHPDFEKFKFESKFGETTDDLCGVFLHPYGGNGYTLAYSHNDYYIVMPNGETYDSYCFNKSKESKNTSAKEYDNLVGKRVLLIGAEFGTIVHSTMDEYASEDKSSHPWQNGFAVKTDNGVLVTMDEIDENSSHEHIHLLEWIQNEGWDMDTEEGMYSLNGEDYTLAGLYEKYLES